METSDSEAKIALALDDTLEDDELEAELQIDNESDQEEAVEMYKCTKFRSS